MEGVKKNFDAAQGAIDLLSTGVLRRFLVRIAH
jgi:hypothetical protein